MERTKNVMRSTLFGVIMRIINIILPFISRTIILRVLGEQYLGLNSLFSSILSFLSLAELGMGGAMVYSMYKPIAEGDNDTLCALVNMYRKFYRVIGIIILVLGSVLTPFLPKLIKGDVPDDINLYVLYFIYLVNTVLSYFLFAYKSSVIQAHQRNDIESKIGMIIAPLSYLVMLTMLAITKNYYAYVIWLPIFTIATNIIRMIWVNRMYPAIKPRGSVEKELKSSIVKKVKALIGTKLNTVVLNAADNIVMAAFLGLTTIAVYGNYYFVMSSITGFLGIIHSSMTAGLGNSLQTESLEKNYKDFQKFSFMNSWLVGWCAICLVCLYQPFMRIWAGDELMFPFYMVLLFALYFYVYMIRRIPVVYKDAAGIWWEDRFRPYVCMITNLVMNIALVQFIGIAGIVISTILSLVVSIPWENYTIFKYVFSTSSKPYYRKMALYFVATILSGTITFGVCSLLGDSIWMLLVRGLICVVLPNALFVLAFHRFQEFSEAKAMILRIIRRR